MAVFQLNNYEFDLLRNYIETNCGIHLDTSKSYLIENRLEALMQEYGCSTFSAFYYKAVADSSKKLQEKIIDAITTNETLWFRDSLPFSIFQRKILPVYVNEMVSKKKNKVRIWSAACSTGQEPYSIAMNIHEFLRGKIDIRVDNFEIIATDISSTVLNIAQAGIYDQLSVSRGLSEEMKNLYFEKSGTGWAVKDSVKRMVTFKKMNLKDDFWGIGNVDIVFCRNVLIYFADDLKKQILNKIASLIKPSGILIVGSSESVSNYTTEYSMVSVEKMLCYQVKGCPSLFS